METREVKIQVPEGYEIDKENSTFECIKFKPKKLTYKDIAKNLFKDNKAYYINTDGTICYFLCSSHYPYSNNAVSKEQWEKLLALNKLINVAKYLNGDWKPDFTNIREEKWFIKTESGKIITAWTSLHNIGTPCFKTAELARQAIEILGEETIKLALSQV